jgi:hypothetical protein
LIGYQGFAENILQESLHDPLIEQGFQQKDSVFLEVFRCEADEMWRPPRGVL